ncbi:MAG: hypothetical protein ACKVZJ_07850 [Phycisphaerales bacterium]
MSAELQEDRMPISATSLSPRPEGSLSGLQHDLRAKAHAVLASLQAARTECDRQLAQLRRADAMKQVTGKSSLDEAISSTQRLIAELDEVSDATAHLKPGCEVEVRFSAARQTIAA